MASVVNSMSLKSLKEMSPFVENLVRIQKLDISMRDHTQEFARCNILSKPHSLAQASA